MMGRQFLTESAIQPTLMDLKMKVNEWRPTKFSINTQPDEASIFGCGKTIFITYLSIYLDTLFCIRLLGSQFYILNYCFGFSAFVMAWGGLGSSNGWGWVSKSTSAFG